MGLSGNAQARAAVGTPFGVVGMILGLVLVSQVQDYCKENTEGSGAYQLEFILVH